MITVPTGYFARLKARITGRVTDRHGTPIPNVTVGLLDFKAGRYTGTTRTAADGTYVIGGIPPGSYVIGYGGALAGWYSPGGLVPPRGEQVATQIVVGRHDVVGIDLAAP